MATYSELSATLKFTDGQTKTINFSPYYTTDSAVSGFKTRAIAINDDIDNGNTPLEALIIDTEESGIKNYVSKISAATITTTDKTVIFAKTESARIEALKMAGDE